MLNCVPSLAVGQHGECFMTDRLLCGGYRSLLHYETRNGRLSRGPAMEKRRPLVRPGLANFKGTVGPHNSLRTHLKVALVYTYIKRGAGAEFIKCC